MATPFLGIDEGPSEAMSHDLPQQNADEKLAQELAEELHEAWLRVRSASYVIVKPSLSAHVIASVCKMFYARHRVGGSNQPPIPRIVIDPLANTLGIIL